MLQYRLKHNRFVYFIYKIIYKTYNYFCKGVIKRIEGVGNCFIKGENTLFYKTEIRISGNNNQIVFGNNCYVGPDCSFWIEGNDCSIFIGNNTTFTMKVHFCVQEDNMSITIGDDCMFANTITVRTSDSHPIYDIKTKKRLNFPSPVVIGDHVWIAPGSLILKGTNIGTGSIIGSNSVVTHDIPEYSLAVGAPSKIVKENINWTREHLF